MGDILETGTRWLAGQLTARASRTVTYSRGALSVDLPATVAQRPLRVNDGMGGVAVVWSNRDYGFNAADLVLGGVRIEPRAGDRIREAEGATTLVQEAMTPDGEENVWRWEDGYYVRLTVHTKLVGRE